MYSIGTSQSMRLSIHIHNSRKTVKKANALLDSGAASTFINKDIVEEYGWETKRLEKPFRLINTDGTPNEEKVKETVLIHYFIKNSKTKEKVFQQMRCYIANIHDDMILGMNWLKKFNPQINWEKETLQFDKPGSIRNEEIQVQEISQMAINVTLSHSQ
jgi:predicted aspartyl protease